MKKINFALVALATVVATTPFAKADQFAYTIIGTGFSANLILTASQIAGQSTGTDVISAVTGSFTDAGLIGTVNLAKTHAMLINANGALAPGYALSPDGEFLYDNVLYTKATGNGVLDWGGLLFSVDGYELNLFSDSNNGGAGFFYWADNGSYHFNDPIDKSDGELIPAVGTLTATPEPGSLLLLGTGLLGLAVVLFRRARRQRPILSW